MFLTFHCIKISKVKKKEICTFLSHKGPKLTFPARITAINNFFFLVRAFKSCFGNTHRNRKNPDNLFYMLLCETCSVQGDLIRALRRLNKKLSEEPNSL